MDLKPRWISVFSQSWKEGYSQCFGDSFHRTAPLYLQVSVVTVDATARIKSSVKNHFKFHVIVMTDLSCGNNRSEEY